MLMAKGLTMERVQAAMKAMMDEAMKKPNEPIAMCIVDAAGNLEAFECLAAVMPSGRHTPRR
jgi:uncharacterized protein GlcG (DUF336 family)